MGYTGGLHIHNKTHSYLALLVHMDQKEAYSAFFGCLKFKFKFHFAGFSSYTLIIYPHTHTAYTSLGKTHLSFWYKRKSKYVSIYDRLLPFHHKIRKRERERSAFCLKFKFKFAGFLILYFDYPSTHTPYTHY